MSLSLVIIIIFLGLQFFFVIWNIRQYPSWTKRTGSKNLSVSILIPARNEEERLPGLLESLISQTNRPLEVLVLNDHSTDHTAKVVAQYAERYAWIQLVEGSPLPKGWLGKPFACHQLSERAKGEWLLFLDADVRLDSEALALAIGEADEQKTGLITGFPRQVVRTWMEKLVVPLMLFTIACHLPIRFVRKSRKPEFCAAHGGFMFVESACYKDVGGHASIYDQMVEDMELAKLIKKKGYPVTLAKIDDSVWMRMYESGSQVFRGYQKNIFPGVGRNLFLLLLVLVMYLFLYVYPFLALILSLILGKAILLAIVACLLGMLIKSWIDWQHRLPFWLGAFQPVSILLFCVIALASVYGSFSKKGYIWKGRRYT